MNSTIIAILNRVAQGAWNHRDTKIGRLSQCAFCCVAPHSVHADDCPVRLSQGELAKIAFASERKLEPHYKEGDVLLCLKDYEMVSGAVAFTDGSSYTIQNMQHFKATKEHDEYVEYVLINNAGENHTLAEEDVAEHFIRYVDWTKGEKE